MDLIILRRVPLRISHGAENSAKRDAAAPQPADSRLLSMDEVRRRWQAKRMAQNGSWYDSPQPA